MNQNILTPEEEKLLAQFVCRLSATVAIDAYKASCPGAIDDQTKEDMALCAIRPALPILNKLGKAYVFAN